MNSTTEFRQKALRAALRIHDHLAGASPKIGNLPEAEWDELRRLTSRLQRAIVRDWKVAGQHVLEDLDYALRRMGAELESYRRELPPSLKCSRRAPPGEILADLYALEQEFEEVELDLGERTVTVKTEPIELESVYLGSFRVELKWEQIGQQRTYDVIAIDPNPPDGDESVTHPHVRSKILCEGDGAAPIKAALAQGWLFDFFTLVRQVLETYNPESPHVSLDRWTGMACTACGWRMPGDDYGTCERCNAALCSECSSGCGSCDRYVCGECISSCARCGETYCSSCLSETADSGGPLCEACLHNQENESDEPLESLPPDGPAAEVEEDQAGSAPSNAEADALYVGEACLPA